MKITRFGFKSKKQLPLFMIWEEYWIVAANGRHLEVEWARVIFNSQKWIGF